jgi:hypothetical protein
MPAWAIGCEVTARTALTRAEIRQLFAALNRELGSRGVHGELYLVGGAVMCLVFEARESTADVDALFRPTRELREAAAAVAVAHAVHEHWLNDAVKAYLSPSGGFDPYLELGALTVFVAQADYLLAMKCLAMRLGAEFHDEADVRYLLRYLNVSRYDEAVAIISRFYPLERFPQKTLYALQELLTV